jgi:HEAT repeat protein
MALGGLTFLLTLGYSTGVSGPRKSRFFSLLLLLSMALLVGARLGIVLGNRSIYPAIWLSVNAISALLGTMVWSTAAEVCDTRQAKRLFPLFASAGILGGMLGNALTGLLAQAVGTENLLLAFAGLLLIGAALVREGARRFFPPAPRGRTRGGAWQDLSAGFRFVRRSPLMILVAIASVLFSVLFFSVSFPFSRLVSTAFSSEAQIAGFLGTFSSVTTGVTFLLSLFVANRLYARLGIVNTILVAPAVYLGGFALWVARFSLPEAVLFRFLQLAVIGGLAGGAWNALFNVAPAERRAQVSAFQAGVPTQAGVVLSGALLILGEHTLTAPQIFTLGIVAALACGLVVWRMRRGYAEALVAALRDGFLEVFSAAPRGLQPIGADAEGLRVALDALADPRPEVRRTAAEILGQLERHEAEGPLLQSLQDPEPEVRAEAVRALARLRATGSWGAVAGCLADPAAVVRRAAVDGYAALGPEAWDTLRPLASDPDPQTRARAAVALAKGNEVEEAMRAISTLLGDPHPAARAAGLAAYREVDLGEPDRILDFLGDGAAVVRREAVRTLTSRQLGGALDRRLADCLDDPDPRVRDEAAEALCCREGGTREAVRVLRSGPARAQEAALKALRGAGEAREAILEWAVTQIDEARRIRGWQAGLEPQGARDALEILFLRDHLQSLREQRESHVVQALEALGSGDSLRLVAKGIWAQDRALQAQAMEALETLGDPRLARALTRLLEGAVEAKAVSDSARTLEELSEEKDPWLRGVALRLRIQQARADLRRWVRTLLDDGHPALRLAAEGISEGRPTAPGEGVEMGETLRTLGTMERVLLLRRVAIFAKLTPEDLQEIAVVAHERVFQEGDALCTEGEEGDELFILVEGRVRVIKQANGEMKTLRIIEPVEQVGELAILRRQPRSATAVAEGGPVRTLVITAQAFASILRDRHEVALATVSALAERLSSVV